MNPAIHTRLDGLARRFEEITVLLTDPAVLQRARAEFEERRKAGIVKGRAS